MDAKLKYYLSDLDKTQAGASNEIIHNVQNELDFELPNDYISIMKDFNGGEGEIGENSWLNLYTIEDLLNVNNDYQSLMEQIPDYFLFGKDAADTGFAFHKSSKSIHSFGLMSDFKTDPIEFCGNDFAEFLEYLYNR